MTELGVKPQVIFLDAVGTLFDVRGSVGEIYAQLAQDFGVQVSVENVQQAFVQSFRASGPAAFPGVELQAIPEYEFQWWRAIAEQTFRQVGVFEQFASFSDFFTHLYAYFATADAWFVYPEVPLVLEHWQRQGISLGVLSNFDSRLYKVLQILELAEFFQSVTISTEVGAAKPNAAIFQAALQKHGLTAGEVAWHIGDSYREDYEGAKAAGLQGFWVKRSHSSLPVSTPTRGQMSMGQTAADPTLVVHPPLTTLKDLIQE